MRDAFLKRRLRVRIPSCCPFAGPSHNRQCPLLITAPVSVRIRVGQPSLIRRYHKLVVKLVVTQFYGGSNPSLRAIFRSVV